MFKPLKEESTALLSKELLKPYPKVVRLIEEFGLLPPTEQTYMEINAILKHGLPLVKSLSEAATIELVSKGKLVTEKTRTGDGFDVIYTSILQNKGYGPITLVLSPNIIADGRFEAYCIDHASTYLNDQVSQVLAMSDDVSDEKVQETEHTVMEKYTLNFDEFFVRRF